MKSKLVVCPFCKSENVELKNTTEPMDFGLSYVTCIHCGARGPEIIDNNPLIADRLAVSGWNCEDVHGN